MTRFLGDQRGAAGLFSVLTLMALVLAIGYTAGLADATLEKMRVQDAVDAASYSGARVRGNMFAMMGLLNVAKMVLHRRANGYEITEGQAAVLLDVARISGIPVDPALLDDQLGDIAGDVGEKARDYAEKISRMQDYIAARDEDGNYAEDVFLAIIESEIQEVARQHDCELLAWSTGYQPYFEDESNKLRYWQLWGRLVNWLEWEPWYCDITRAVEYVDSDWSQQDGNEYPPDPPPVTGPEWWNQSLLEQLEGNPDWLPRVISPTNKGNHSDNSVHVVLQRGTHASTVLPGVLQSHFDSVQGTASGACFSQTLTDQLRFVPLNEASANLYTTDFTAELVSLKSSGFRDWLENNYPTVADQVPWVDELVKH